MIFALVVRITLVLGAGWLVALVLRRSASTRHLVWTATLAGVSLTAVVGALAGPVRIYAGSFPALPTILHASLPFRTTIAIHLIWALGAAALMLRLGRDVWLTRGLAAEAAPNMDPAWEDAMGAAAADLRLRRRMSLRMTPRSPVPLAWGVIQPVVLIPSDSDGWSEERRRAVLLHELSHVRRRDCAVDIFVAVTCALFWFHPGVWLAARRLRLECERACDEAVLGAGTPPSEYAEHLVAILRLASRRRPGALAALGLGSGSTLEQRLLALLERRPDPEARRWLAFAALAPLGMAAVLGVTAPVDAGTPADYRPVRHASAAVGGKCDCAARLAARASRARAER